ncbi:MAG: hypothetical protein ABIL18_08375 [candidate division WOR-3 bacterium]
MKLSVIILGAILFVAGLLFAYSGSIISLYLIIGGLGCFIAGIILELIAKSKIKKEEKTAPVQKKKFFGSNLDLIVAGIVFFIVASIGLPGFRKSTGYWIFIILGIIGSLLILLGLIQMVISMIKDEERRWQLFLGWVFFIFGAILSGSATLPPQKTSLFILIIGIILVIAGLIFISLHIRTSNLKGIAQVRQILNNLGGIFLVCGFVGIGLIGYNPSLQKVFYIVILAAIVSYLISLILKTFSRKNTLGENNREGR